MATKKKVVKKAAAKKVTDPASFAVVKERSPFMTFKITEQTVYWGALSIYIFALSLWVLNLQLDLLDVLNQVTNASL